MASEFKVDIIKDLAGTGPVDLYKQEAPKVRVTWDGIADTITESLNVSSVISSAAGRYTTAWTAAMLNGNYTIIGSSIAASAGRSGGMSPRLSATISTTGISNLDCVDSSNLVADTSRGSIIILGDLA